MPRTDIWAPSPARVELDQRSREARLQLERVERLLVVRPLQRWSLLRRLLRVLGSRIYAGEQVKGRSAKATPIRRRARQGQNTSGGTRVGAGCASNMISWRTCRSSVRLNLAIPSRGARIEGGFPIRISHRATGRWNYSCRRRGLNCRFLSDIRS
jgi:hypothetical protein